MRAPGIASSSSPRITRSPSPPTRFAASVKLSQQLPSCELWSNSRSTSPSPSLKSVFDRESDFDSHEGSCSHTEACLETRSNLFSEVYSVDFGDSRVVDLDTGDLESVSKQADVAARTHVTPLRNGTLRLFCRCCRLRPWLRAFCSRRSQFLSAHRTRYALTLAHTDHSSGRTTLTGLGCVRVCMSWCACLRENLHVYVCVCG